MVDKLRKKFVITAILSLLLILVTMIGIINAINMHQVVSDADTLLETLASNDGYFPTKSAAPKKRPSLNNSNAFDWDDINFNHSTETPFQSRYFWVRMDSSANIIKINTIHIASVSYTTAEEYAKDLYSKASKKMGFYHSYRYLIADEPEGSKLIIFLDLSTAIINSKQLLIQSVAIGLLALIAMFILVFLFSGQAVAPAVESLEKQKRFLHPPSSM